MKQFEIYSWQPPNWPEPHPCVIISHPDRAARKPEVEVLLCASQNAKRQPEPHEIILDQEDGLDWQTLCKCDLIYAVNRKALGQKRGEVIQSRRQHLLRTVIGAHFWGETLAGAAR